MCLGYADTERSFITLRTSICEGGIYWYAYGFIVYGHRLQNVSDRVLRSHVANKLVAKLSFD